MNKIIPLAMAILFCISPANSCYPQNAEEEHELITVDGKVLSIDTSRSTITIKATNKLTFSVPTDTVLMNDINTITLLDIDPGDDVTIEHYRGPSGNLIATKITVENREI